MLYEVGKKLFTILMNLLNLIRVLLVFLAFFTVLYWILNIAKVPSVEVFTPFFDSIKDFVHLYYNRTVQTDEVTVDFSFLIFSLVLLAIVWGLKYVVEFIQTLEGKYDIIYQKIKNQTEALFNINLQKSYVGMENKNKKFLVLVKFTASDAEGEMSYKAKPQEVLDQKQKEALEEFSKTYMSKTIVQKKIVENSLLLYFGDFEDIDHIILELSTNIDHLKQKYRRDKWILDSFVGIETYSEDKYIFDKYKKLKTVLKLNLKNELICLGTFRQRYLLVKNPHYILDCKGLYDICGDKEDVFDIRKIS